MNRHQSVLQFALAITLVTPKLAMCQESVCSSGDGTFGAAVPYAPGANYPAIASADVNADGIVDLVALSTQNLQNDLALHVGVGDGSFLPATSLPLGLSSAATALDIGDVNNDQVPDIVATGSDGTLAVLLGTGGGTFDAPLPSSLGALSRHPSGVVLGDLDGDGNLDMVIAQRRTPVVGAPDAIVLLGSGDGSFSAPMPYPAMSVSGELLSILVADLNEDGALDIVAAGWTNGVRVLIGTGQGAFSAASQALTQTCSFVAVGDLNADSHIDIVASVNGVSIQESVEVLLGNGDGTFQPSVSYSISYEPHESVIADFNGDGYQDVAVLTPSSGSCRILAGASDGSLSQMSSVPFGQVALAGLAAFDFNGDGATDLAISNQSSGVWVALAHVVGDASEPNDSCAAGTTLMPGLTEGLGLWGDGFPSGRNDDFWTYLASPNEIVTLDVLFDHLGGDIDVELFDDGSCTSVVAASNSLTSDEQVVYMNATNTTVELTMRVVPVGSDFACNSYSIALSSVVDRCLTVPEDVFAPNHDCASAILLGPGSYPGLATFSGELGDFYAIDVLAGYSLDVGVLHAAAAGNLDCYLYDSGLLFTTCGDEYSDMVRGATDNDDETLSWSNSTGATQTYILQVRLRDDPQTGNCGEYALTIDVQPTPVATVICSGDGSLVPCPCGNESVDPESGCTNATGSGAKMTATGSNSVAADDLVFHLSQGRVGQPTMLVQGWTLTAVAFKDGILCTGNPTKRMEVMQLDVNGSGSTTSSIVTEGTIPGPGVTRFYQFWYRDPAISPCGTGSNFSSGLRVTWN